MFKEKSKLKVTDLYNFVSNYCPDLKRIVLTLNWSLLI